MAIDQNLIDKNVLKNLCDAIGVESMDRFYNLFLEDCRVRTKKIIEAYEKSQYSEMELQAHTLGTSAATYGASMLEEICREIELSKPEKSALFQDRIDQLSLLSNNSMEALEDYFRS